MWAIRVFLSVHYIAYDYTKVFLISELQISATASPIMWEMKLPGYP